MKIMHIEQDPYFAMLPDQALDFWQEVLIVIRRQPSGDTHVQNLAAVLRIHLDSHGSPPLRPLSWQGSDDRVCASAAATRSAAEIRQVRIHRNEAMPSPTRRPANSG
jgi:hypothetical protein